MFLQLAREVTQVTVVLVARNPGLVLKPNLEVISLGGELMEVLGSLEKTLPLKGAILDSLTLAQNLTATVSDAEKVQRLVRVLNIFKRFRNKIYQDIPYIILIWVPKMFLPSTTNFCTKNTYYLES